MEDFCVTLCKDHNKVWIIDCENNNNYNFILNYIHLYSLHLVLGSVHVYLIFPQNLTSVL